MSEICVCVCVFVSGVKFPYYISIVENIFGGRCPVSEIRALL
jgi:hypothetical protein